MAAEDGTFLNSPRQRVLAFLGGYVAVSFMVAGFVDAVAVVTLRVGGFHELDT